MISWLENCHTGDFLTGTHADVEPPPPKCIDTHDTDESVAKTYTLGGLDSRILWMTYYCIQIYTHVKEVKIKMEQYIKVSLHQAVKITNGVNVKHDFPGQPF